MYFEDMNSLLQMGGHGGFVWASYGITLLVIVALLLFPLRRRRRLLREIHAEQRRRAGAREAG